MTSRLNPAQVESALEYEAGPIRSKTLKILRNLLAKHDCDTRYVEVVRCKVIRGQLHDGPESYNQFQRSIR